MSTVTACDHCGQPINGGRVAIHVTDYYLPKMSDVSAPIPEDLHLRLDLHRACYVEHLLPHITASIGAPDL